jgi:hypothetical protein
MDTAKYEYQSEFGRRYLAQGIAEGTAEGQAELVLTQLARRAGSLANAAIGHVRAGSRSRPLRRAAIERAQYRRSVQ